MEEIDETNQYTSLEVAQMNPSQRLDILAEEATQFPDWFGRNAAEGYTKGAARASNWDKDQENLSDFIMDGKVKKSQMEKGAQLLGAMFTMLNMPASINYHAQASSPVTVQLPTDLLEETPERTPGQALDMFLGGALQHASSAAFQKLADFKEVNRLRQQLNETANTGVPLRLQDQITLMLADEMVGMKLGAKYPGYAKFLGKYKQHLYGQLSPERLDGASDHEHLLDLLLRIIRFPQTINQDELTKFDTSLKSIRRAFESVRGMPKSLDEACKLSRKLVDILKKYQPEEPEPPESPSPGPPDPNQQPQPQPQGTPPPGGGGSSKGDGKGDDKSPSGQSPSGSKPKSKPEPKSEPEESDDDSNDTDDDAGDEDNQNGTEPGSPEPKTGDEDDQDEDSDGAGENGEDDEPDDDESANDAGNNSDDDDEESEDEDDNTGGDGDEDDEVDSDLDDFDDNFGDEPEHEANSSTFPDDFVPPPQSEEEKEAIRRENERREALQQDEKKQVVMDEEALVRYVTQQLKPAMVEPAKPENLLKAQDFEQLLERVIAPDEPDTREAHIKLIKGTISEIRYKHSLASVSVVKTDVLRQLMQRKNRDYQFSLKGMKSGRLDTNKLVEGIQGVDTIYERKGTVKTDKLSVTVLIDQSGSMSGEKLERARQAAIFLCEAFGNLRDVELFIYGHNTTGGDATQIFIYREPGYQNKYALGGVDYGGCNNDGHAIWFVANRVRSFTKNAGLFLVISDGMPSYGNGVEHTRQMVNKVENTLEMQVIQVAIASVNSAMMFKHWVDMKNIQSFPQDLTEFLKNKLNKLIKTRVKL